ncbi:MULTISPECIES: bifunctional phosphopantothenoylcysteine decarboxylase/phosphopantothenate--cysteine ligase CoaBC [unclassified Facklamia]|uniref:bifunctional phosphopantothenoylcysteine decarboxylase/phosphopantothenate--cysteine ligase CoaBC n=1 Tax=Aerococcaceae TaxID=186827 RepID=UPI0013BDBDB5|nr:MULTISPECIES: bifunctional phosphopantothenoylcysteine decarboxylase/phosphopantothenate--cysteine ligase CoaBC [unclassified Facklamia]NEW63875.1 bifunctional phosphopantothenoylcysteine decarboxylase/phosphopantothenate--cysteine ligase CoaBC [Facklamia sp. 252]NEW67346.1 bifunctional phosphopantothenoylcysteine decarboxylase/phosphopantothenate--cysteine ligase CoaBC [Facklamia sp. 253]QQD65223.1 bifunctional phosphopantothenoylcysteine decarboxylase/phosphopantothenate--cysteine ligase Co
MLTGKKIGLFITGGIAAYKMAELSRQFIKKGAEVRVVMSQAACEFITPLTMQTLTKQPVLVDVFDEKDPATVQHIHMADWCDYVVVAPATANSIAKMAQGIGDDIVSTTLLAVHCPRLIVPAMNSNMYLNPATQRNLAQLKEDGYDVMTPDTGFLAEGYSGIGRLPELTAIVEQLEWLIAKTTLPQVLNGKKVVISAGGTRERIDPVRYISNDSTGKMGYAMARAARDLGANVTLVSTVPQLTTPQGVTVHYVASAQEMMNEMVTQLEQQDIFVMTAAVSDYRVAEIAEQKIKKQAGQQGLQLNLIENPDILAHLGHHKKSGQLVIGFAAETQDVENYAMKKLAKKQADWIIANDVSRKDIGFNSDANQVTLISRHQEPITSPFADKLSLSHYIWQMIMASETENK